MWLDDPVLNGLSGLRDARDFPGFKGLSGFKKFLLRGNIVDLAWRWSSVPPSPPW